MPQQYPNLMIDANLSISRVGQLLGARLQNVTSAGRATLQEQIRFSEENYGENHAGHIIFDVEEGALFLYNPVSREFESVTFDVQGDVSYRGTISPATSNTEEVEAVRGYQYVVNAAGTLAKTGVTFYPFAEVEIGDIVLFWDASTAYVLQTNFGPATEDKAGTIDIASQADVNAGTDSSSAVTPFTLTNSLLADEITANTVAHGVNATDISALETFVGFGPLQTTSLNIAEAVNELVDRADSDSQEIDALKTFVGSEISLSTVAQNLAEAFNELLSRLDSADTRRTATEGNVSSLQTFTGEGTALDTVATDLAAAINELRVEIRGNDSDAKQEVLTLESFQTENVSADNTINQGQFALYALKLRQDDVDSDLASLEASIVDLYNQKRSNDVDISGIIARLDSDDGDLSVLKTEMDAVEGRLTVNETDISTLQSDMTEAESRMTAVEGRLSTNETDIDNLEAAVGTIGNLETGATDLVSAINELHSEIAETGNDSDIAVNTADISSLDGFVGSETLNTTAQSIAEAINELHTAFNNTDSDFVAIDTRAAFKEQSPEVKAYNQDSITLPENTAVTITHNLNLPNPAGFTVGVMDASGDLLNVEVDVVDANSINVTSYEELTGVSIFILGLMTAMDLSGSHPAGVDRVVNGVIVPDTAIFMQGSFEDYVITQEGVIIVTNP